MAEDATNVQAHVEGDILYVEVDLAQRHGATTSKKGFKIATTNWGLEVARTSDDKPIVLSLNVYTKGDGPGNETPVKSGKAARKRATVKA